MPQAGDPAECRHGHRLAAAAEADNTGSACLQCCGHPGARPYLHLPSAACQPCPHPHPGLAFSGEFPSPRPPSFASSALIPPQTCFATLSTWPGLLPAFLSSSQTVFLGIHRARQESSQTKGPRELGKESSGLSGVGIPRTTCVAKSTHAAYVTAMSGLQEGTD